MLQNYCLAVPCKRYIRKYFTALYGHPVALSHQSDFADTILTKMASRPLAQVNKRVLNIAFKDFNEEIKFQLPMDFFYRIDHQLTDQQIYNINRFLENCFKADLYQVVNCAAFFGVEFNTSIEAFARKYNIILDEDITFHALQKNYYRYRKSATAKNVFLLQMSSPFQLSLRA